MGKDFFMISFILNLCCFVGCFLFFFFLAEWNQLSSMFQMHAIWSRPLHLGSASQKRVCAVCSFKCRLKYKLQLNICLIYYFFFIVQNEWNFSRTNQLTRFLPDLNMSQRQAVAKALNENFTLVWGPPGN